MKTLEDFTIKLKVVFQRKSAIYNYEDDIR